MLHGKFTALNTHMLEKFKINELNVWLQNLGKQQMILKKVAPQVEAIINDTEIKGTKEEINNTKICPLKNLLKWTNLYQDWSGKTKSTNKNLYTWKTWQTQRERLKDDKIIPTNLYK